MTHYSKTFDGYELHLQDKRVSMHSNLNMHRSDSYFVRCIVCHVISEDNDSSSVCDKEVHNQQTN